MLQRKPRVYISPIGAFHTQLRNAAVEFIYSPTARKKLDKSHVLNLLNYTRNNGQVNNSRRAKRNKNQKKIHCRCICYHIYCCNTYPPSYSHFYFLNNHRSANKLFALLVHTPPPISSYNRRAFLRYNNAAADTRAIWRKISLSRFNITYSDMAR